MLNKKSEGGGNRIFTALGSDIFRWLVYGWFVFQSTFMALSTSYGISPDERYHYTFIQIFEMNGWLPFIHNLFGNFQIGDVVHSPFFLYHYLLSLPYHLFASSGHALIYLRVINIIIVLVAFCFVVKIARKLKMSALATNLGIFMAANTLMFVFLAGMVNYDSLFILLGLITFDLLLSLLERFRITEFIGLLITLLAGVLTLINFIPIALVASAVLIAKYRNSFGEIKLAFPNLWSRKRGWNIFLTSVFLLLSFLFIQRDVSNLIKYHTVSPSCEKTMSVSDCRRSAIYIRDQALDNTHPTTSVKSFGGYIGGWLSFMRERTFGIFGHKVTSATKYIDWWIQVFILLSLVAVIRLYRLKERKITLILGAFLVYVVILYIDNYQGYHRLGIAGVAVQGRYLFVFLPLLYIIANEYILEFLRQSSIRLIYVLLTLLAFTSAGLPSYIVNTDRSWYTDSSAKLNLRLHDNLDRIYQDK